MALMAASVSLIVSMETTLSGRVFKNEISSHHQKSNFNVYFESLVGYSENIYGVHERHVHFEHSEILLFKNSFQNHYSLQSVCIKLQIQQNFKCEWISQ